jgi:hypothetical protein
LKRLRDLSFQSTIKYKTCTYKTKHKLMYILITVIFILSLIAFFLAAVFEEEGGCTPAIIGVVLLILSIVLLYFKIGWDRQKTIDYIYNEGYKRGQIYCINGDMHVQKKLNKEGEYVYQDTKSFPSPDKYLNEHYIHNLYNVEKIFRRGFKRGQIDCSKGIIEYERITNDDGEVIFRKIKE